MLADKLPELVVNIIVALVSAGGFWALIERGLEKSREKREESIQQLIAEVKEIKKDLKETTELSKAYSRDRLNYLSEKYMREGYIPKEDIISYKLLGSAYIAANGNTEVRTKFEHNIENLEVK